MFLFHVNDKIFLWLSCLCGGDREWILFTFDAKNENQCKQSYRLRSF